MEAEEAAPEQEPVAFTHPNHIKVLQELRDGWCGRAEYLYAYYEPRGEFNTALYTTPPDAAAQIAELETELQERRLDYAEQIAKLEDDLDTEQQQVGKYEEQIATLEAELSFQRNAHNMAQEALLEQGAEIADIKEVQFPRKVQAVADGWKGKVERLTTELAACRKDADKWKQMAEYQYALRVYPNNLDLGVGALDAYFNGWSFEAAIKKP
jgi:hypothetical protein